MPWWLSLLISLAIKIGLPAIENHLSPEIVKIIEGILKSIGNAANPTAEINRIKDLHQCNGVGCPPSLKT